MPQTASCMQSLSIQQKVQGSSMDMRARGTYVLTRALVILSLLSYTITRQRGKERQVIQDLTTMQDLSG